MSEPALQALCWLLGWKGWSLIYSPGIAEVGAISGTGLAQHLSGRTRCRGNKIGFVACFSFSSKEKEFLPPSPLFKEKKPFLGLHAVLGETPGLPALSRGSAAGTALTCVVSPSLLRPRRTHFKASNRNSSVGVWVLL